MSTENSKGIVNGSTVLRVTNATRGPIETEVRRTRVYVDTMREYLGVQQGFPVPFGLLFLLVPRVGLSAWSGRIVTLRLFCKLPVSAIIYAG